MKNLKFLLITFLLIVFISCKREAVTAANSRFALEFTAYNTEGTKQFVVYLSTDGKNFFPAQTIQPVQQAAEHSYNATFDYKPLPNEKLYSCIGEVDLQGQETRSSIVTVQ